MIAMSGLVRPSSTEPQCLHTPEFVKTSNTRPQVVGKSSSEHSFVRMIPRARSPLSIEASIKLMDHFHEASFHPWIKNQANARISSRHLARIMVDYTDEQVAAGFRWLFEEWQLVNIALVLRVTLVDLQVERRRKEAILRMVTAGWARNHIEHLFKLLKIPVEKLY